MIHSRRRLSKTILPMSLTGGERVGTDPSVNTGASSFSRKFVKLAVLCQVAVFLIIFRNDIYAGRYLLERSKADKLVVYNAVGGAQNLAIISHSRNTSFPQEEWDCQIFMYAKEDRIPDDDKHLRYLIDDAGCTIPRTPGMFWGHFLQFITPTLVSNYDYVALVLDDIFIPTTGDSPVDINKMIQSMEEHNIHVMSPGVVGDSHGYIARSKESGVEKCIAEANFQETYLQVFTRDAWGCFYDMLHYDGGKGWFYDICYKPSCPDVRMGYDFSMEVYHVVKDLPADLIQDTDLVDWRQEPKVFENSYFDNTVMTPRKILERLNCDHDGKMWDLTKISCPAPSDEEIVNEEAEELNEQAEE